MAKWRHTALPPSNQSRAEKLASFRTSQAWEHNGIVGQEFVELRNELVELTVPTKSRRIRPSAERFVVERYSHKERSVLCPGRSSDGVASLSEDENSGVDDLLPRQVTGQGVDGGNRDAVKETLYKTEQPVRDTPRESHVRSARVPSPFRGAPYLRRREPCE